MSVTEPLVLHTRIPQTAITGCRVIGGLPRPLDLVVDVDPYGGRLKSEINYIDICDERREHRRRVAERTATKPKQESPEETVTTSYLVENSHYPVFINSKAFLSGKKTHFGEN